MSKTKIQHLSNCLQIVGTGSGPCICWLLRAEIDAVLDAVDEVYADTDGRPSYEGVRDAIEALKGGAHE